MQAGSEAEMQDWISVIQSAAKGHMVVEEEEAPSGTGRLPDSLFLDDEDDGEHFEGDADMYSSKSRAQQGRDMFSSMNDYRKQKMERTPNPTR
jgi:hypothetical protein